MPTSSVMTPAVAQLVANRAKGAENGAIQVSGQNQKSILAVPGKDDPMKIEGMTKGMHNTQTEPAEAASPIVRGEMAQNPPEDVAAVLNGGYYNNDPFLPPCTPFTPFQFSPSAPWDKIDEQVDEQIDREQEYGAQMAQQKHKQKQQRKRKRAPGTETAAAKKKQSATKPSPTVDLSTLDSMKKKLLAVWQLINDFKFALPFRKPVQEKDAPGYFSKIAKPMDLSKIKQQIEDGSTNTFEQLKQLVVLIQKNALEFNGTDGEVCEYAKELQTFSVGLIAAAAVQGDKASPKGTDDKPKEGATEDKTKTAAAGLTKHPNRPSLQVETTEGGLSPGGNVPLLSGAAAELVAQAIATNTNAAGGSTAFRTLIDQAQTMSGDPLVVNRIQDAMKVFKGNSAGNTKRMLEDLLPGGLRRPRVTPSKKKTPTAKKPGTPGPKKVTAKKTPAFPPQRMQIMPPAYEEQDDLFACSTSEDSHSDVEQRIEELPQDTELGQDGWDQEEWEHEDWEQQMDQLDSKTQGSMADAVRTPTDATQAKAAAMSPVCSPTGVLDLAPESVKATDLGRLSPSARLFQPALRELLQQPPSTESN